MKWIVQATMLVSLAVAGGTACASAGGGRGSKCGLTQADTIYRPVGMVYRPCAVDREARLISNPRPTFTPNGSGAISCYSAEFEFVVDESGRPVTQTVHTLRSNDRSFEGNVSQLIPGLTYEPAMKDGHPVNQITSWGQKLSVARMIVPAGAPIRPPQQRPPVC